MRDPKLIHLAVMQHTAAMEGGLYGMDEVGDVWFHMDEGWTRLAADHLVVPTHDSES